MEHTVWREVGWVQDGPVSGWFLFLLWVSVCMASPEGGFSDYIPTRSLNLFYPFMASVTNMSLHLLVYWIFLKLSIEL